MTPLLLVLAGLVALAGGFAVLRSFGPGFRIGRLLASTPRVSVADALRLATSGERRYVRIDGRIDSDAEFEDADHRPLVLRRTRLETQVDGRWSSFEDNREVVPFEIREGLDAIAVDGAGLGDGLVVVRRESSGTAADLPDRAPSEIPGDSPARAIIEQISSVEHAIVLGVPRRTESGRALMGAGLGRPLILTTLELDEAMRVLTGGRRGRSMLAAALLVAGAVLALLGAAWLVLGALAPHTVLAASPTPSLLPGSDTRSSGQGPGLVGDPGLAILVVLAIALLAVFATTAYVRLTGGARQ
ncbi:MAG: hypothetical protein ACAH65_09025 [Chloroflexota bacterium]